VRSPDFSHCAVEESKCLGYLLSQQHPTGRSKARFLAQFGFNASNWPSPARALRAHAVAHPVVATTETRFGVKYTIDGPIDTPGGERPRIRAVWIVEPPVMNPRLVTIHPL
jgi:hypothetical protein